MKQLHRLIIKLLLLSTTLTFSCKSSNDFAGVYAGVRLSINPLGGGMNRTDEVYLFRKDKTFTDQLNKKDWKTAVRGQYEIKGSKVLLTYSNGKTENFTITKNGNLDAGTYILTKMELDNSVPKGAYRFKFMSSSGGMATGTTYVGTSTNKTLNFDGNGNFTTDRQSTTVIAGDNIGGGTNTNSDGKGKYTLKDGSLTLIYDNGTTTTHSFFASAGSGRDKTMAVIDGNFYFTDDDKEKTEAKKENKTSAPLPSATTIFNEARKVHGGDAIDRLENYTIIAEFSGIELISYNDLKANRFRNEMRNKGKLLAVEQIGPNGGWLWNNGKKTSSDAQRLQEVKYNDYTGVLGLLKKNSAVFGKGKVEATKNGYAVSFEVDRNQFVYLLDDKYQLLGSAYQIGKRKQSSTYSNFKTIDGINMPFTTVTSDGKSKITMRYKTIEMNKGLQTDWEEL